MCDEGIDLISTAYSVGNTSLVELDVLKILYCYYYCILEYRMEVVNVNNVAEEIVYPYLCFPSKTF